MGIRNWNSFGFVSGKRLLFQTKTFRSMLLMLLQQQQCEQYEIKVGSCSKHQIFFEEMWLFVKTKSGLGKEKSVERGTPSLRRHYQENILWKKVQSFTGQQKWMGGLHPRRVTTWEQHELVYRRLKTSKCNPCWDSDITR